MRLWTEPRMYIRCRQKHGVVSVLEPPIDEERGSKVGIPFELVE